MIFRNFLLTLILFIFFGTGLLSRNGEQLVLMMPAMVYLCAAIFYRPEKIRLKIRRSVSSKCIICGEPVVVNIEIENKGSKIDEIFIKDILPERLEVSEGTGEMLTSLEPDEVVSWEYTLHPGRGYYLFKKVKAEITDSLGLIRKGKLFSTEQKLTVQPQAVKLKRFMIRPRRTMVYSGIIPTRKGGTGIDFMGVREYQQGDSPRLINWKAGARHPRTHFTNEFEQERVADIGIIFDSRRSSYFSCGNESLFECAVSAAASLSEALLKDGNRVGLLVYGGFVDWTFPATGKVQQEKILRTLTRIQPYTSSIFDEMDCIPTRLFPSHSQLVFISPLKKDDDKALIKLQARKYQVMVVSPNPVSFEEKWSEGHPEFEMGKRIVRIERELMMRKLLHAGIKVLDWHLDMPFHNAVNLSLNRQFSNRQNIAVG